MHVKRCLITYYITWKMFSLFSIAEPQTNCAVHKKFSEGLNVAYNK